MINDNKIEVSFLNNIISHLLKMKQTNDENYVFLKSFDLKELGYNNGKNL